MATLNMNGPFTLNTQTVDSKVTRKSAGNYALGYNNTNDKFSVCYVGRSDSDVASRLESWINNTKRPLFKFSYATSPKAAFEKECKNYHDFTPTDNSVHPQRPDNTNWKCPDCNTFG